MARAEPDFAAVKRLVEAALELPASGRMAHIEATADAELRVAAVRLLDACERAAGSPVLDAPAAAFAARLIDEVEERSTIGALRDALADRYTIEREIGRGGMATVYLAHDARHGRDVAVKLLRPGIAPGDGPTDGAARFEREIAIAARLSHPHILPLYDSGTADGLLFYITPFVDGESLRERLRRSGSPPVAESVRLLRDVTRALSYAHRQGVVHCDVKPANILLNREGDPLVADFGVSRALAAVRADTRQEDAEQTDGTLVVGTPAYMAPEQVVGAPDVDRRADFYALGIVAYELLVGAPPFAGRPRHEQLAAHVAEVPEPVGERRPDVPSALAGLVARLLAKRPDDRPRDATEILEVLEDLLTDPALGATSRNTAAPEAPARRGTLDLEAYELFLKGRHLLGTRQRDALHGALQYFEQAIARDGQFARAHSGMADAWVFLSVFGHILPSEGFPRGRMAAERALELDGTIVEARATLAHIMFVYDWNWDGADAALRRAIALDPAYPVLRMYYASYLHSVGESDEALAQLEAARELDPVGKSGLLRGRILVDTHRPEEAISVLREEVELEPRRDLGHQCLAHAYLQLGEDAEAVASMQRAAALSGPRDTAQLVYVYARTGDAAAARRTLTPLLRHEHAAELLGFHLAMGYAGLGEADEAFRWLEAAYAERASFMNLLGVATGFEAIRDDPRFGELLGRMGLGQAPAG